MVMYNPVRTFLVQTSWNPEGPRDLTLALRVLRAVELARVAVNGPDQPRVTAWGIAERRMPLPKLYLAPDEADPDTPPLWAQIPGAPATVLSPGEELHVHVLVSAAVAQAQRAYAQYHDAAKIVWRTRRVDDDVFQDQVRVEADGVTPIRCAQGLERPVVLLCFGTYDHCKEP